MYPNDNHRSSHVQYMCMHMYMYCTCTHFHSSPWPLLPSPSLRLSSPVAPPPSRSSPVQPGWPGTERAARSWPYSRRSGSGDKCRHTVERRGLAPVRGKEREREGERGGEKERERERRTIINVLYMYRYVYRVYANKTHDLISAGKFAFYIGFLIT